MGHDCAARCLRDFGMYLSDGGITFLLHSRWACRNGKLVHADEGKVRCPSSTIVSIHSFSIGHFTSTSELTYLIYTIAASPPFNQGNIFGFCAVFTCNCVWAIVVLSVTVFTSSLLFTMRLFFGTFRAHFESMFGLMSDLAAERASGNELRLKSCLIEAMDFHIRTKE